MLFKMMESAARPEDTAKIWRAFTALAKGRSDASAVPFLKSVASRDCRISEMCKGAPAGATNLNIYYPCLCKLIGTVEICGESPGRPETRRLVTAVCNPMLNPRMIHKCG